MELLHHDLQCWERLVALLLQDCCYRRCDSLSCPTLEILAVFRQQIESSPFRIRIYRGQPREQRTTHHKMLATEVLIVYYNDDVVAVVNLEGARLLLL